MDNKILDLNTTVLDHEPSPTRKSRGQTEEVRIYITNLLLTNKTSGIKTVDLRSGDIHKKLQLFSKMPIVCNAMTSLQLFRYEVIQSPPKGRGSNLVLRYFLDS